MEKEKRKLEKAEEKEKKKLQKEKEAQRKAQQEQDKEASKKTVKEQSTAINLNNEVSINSSKLTEVVQDLRIMICSLGGYLVAEPAH